MVNTCAACARVIRGAQPTIKCTKCISSFHPICINISDIRKISDEERTNWECPMCQSRVPKRDNSNTPVRGAVSGSIVSTEHQGAIALPNVRTHLTPTPLTPTMSPTDAAPSTNYNELSSLISTLLTETKQIREDISDMKTHIKSLTDHVKNCVTRIDEHEAKIEDAVCRIGLLEQSASKIIQCESVITKLRYELNRKEQAHLKNEVEISGITELPEENPMHLVHVVANKLGVTINNKDVDFAIRVGPRNREPTVANVGTNNLRTMGPRPIVVRFLRQYDREEFLKASRVRRNLNTDDIEVTGSKRNIYINERLTQENRQLFRSARQHSKNAGFKFCWIKNASVYIRKQEGNPAIPIRNWGDLQSRFDLPPE